MRALFDNLPLKLASLVLASLLWLVIAGEKTSELGLEVPVELRNFPQGVELLEEPPRTVEVRLRASPGLLQGLGKGEVHAALDLTGVGAGERILHLTPESIQVPFGVDVVKITPSMVTLQFEPTVERSVPVRPNVTGQPADGYELVELTVSPQEIGVTGPASRVEAVRSAYTEPISLEGARGPLSADVAAGLSDPLLRIGGTRRVRVSAEIRERQAERAFEAVELSVEPGFGRPRPARVAVTIRGPASVVAEVSREHVRARVDAEGADEQGWAPVVVELVGGYRELAIVSVEPERVRLAGASAR